MCFADFWANFYDFFYYCFVLLPQMGIEDNPITCFLVNTWLTNF